MSVRHRSPLLLALSALLPLTFLASPAPAWDAVGHRAIAWLAIDGLDPAMPAFIKEKNNVHSIGWEAAEPDRWRNIKQPVYLAHENNPDHYLDIEDLERFGLTLETVPPLRMRYIAVMAVQRHEHPRGLDDKLEPYNEKLDPSGQQEWPGFVLHAMVEHHAKLVSTFKTYRTLEKLADPVRGPQMEMTKANIMVEMGVLAHFVGDTAQPLHTTKHHHGWVGDNPQGFTVDRGFHSYIDGTVLSLHKLDYNTLKPTQAYTHKVEADPWNEVVAHLQRSHDKVVELYALQKSGELQKEAGKAFISERLHDGADMLSALYNNAWKMSEPSEQDIKDFIRYDNFAPAQLPGGAPAKEKAVEQSATSPAAR